MIIAFTGAGISKESGIPTFEDMGDTRDKLSRQFARTRPLEYQKIIDKLIRYSEEAIPNNAHIALAQYDIPILTMNIDNLHQRVGSKHVVNLHGELPNNIVLYGDSAPNYQIAYDWVELLRDGDIFLIIGASKYTNVALSLRVMAISSGARVVEIQDNAATKVPEFLSKNKDSIGTFEEFINRVNS